MQIAMSRTREQFPLSPRKIIKKTLARTIAWVILFVIIIGVLVAVGVTADSRAATRGIVAVAALAAGSLLGFIVLLTYLYQWWYFAVYYYDLTSDYVVIRKGPITPSEITIPYERIQDVYVDQDLLDRFFGLYDVHISTPTVDSGRFAHIDGVDKVGSKKLKLMILERVNTSSET